MHRCVITLPPLPLNYTHWNTHTELDQVLLTYLNIHTCFKSLHQIFSIRETSNLEITNINNTSNPYVGTFLKQCLQFEI